MNDPIRLSKRLIELTGCSRREAELYIEGGWVTVNGEVVEAPQYKVSQEKVVLLPNASASRQEPATLLLHIASGHAADKQEAALGPQNHWTEDRARRPLQQHFKNLRSCVPLQAGAHGLHIVTQDWRVERKLRESLSKLEQEYIVEVEGSLSPTQLKRLQHGLTFNGSPLAPCKVSWQNETHLRFALKNPLPGQLVFMCQSFKLRVLTLKRIRVGAVAMAKVPSGQWRYLAPGERF